MYQNKEKNEELGLFYELLKNHCRTHVYIPVSSIALQSGSPLTEQMRKE